MYKSIEQIETRKEELRSEIKKKKEELGMVWNTMSVPKKTDTTGELIANSISTGVKVLDIFLLTRKVLRKYGIGVKKEKPKKKKWFQFWKKDK